MNPDFRLRTLDLDGDPDCHQHLISYMPYPSKKFRQNPFTIFQLSNGQTDRQTNKPVGDMDRTYTGDADAVIDYGLLIAT